ncbi:DUF1906 domain-containing protein [Polycladidibacter stylochi]|uniref:DUF1906 domain-containing protein n=1 Tax=Polycladidibacter stylochi TaxID=1807766 RepID=UPI0008365159|nr:DUF1906 domain-containing protein [Pseudovibrio stylochi]
MSLLQTHINASQIEGNVYGLDTAQNTSAYALAIAQAGFRSVGRYYSKSSWKVLTRQEALDLSTAGLKIFVVYQDSNNSPSSFSYEAGQSAATTALTLAHGVGQPQGSAIYFAVDYDASQSDYDNYIKPYLEGVNATFETGGNPYSTGIYGSGLICNNALNDELVQFSWLSQSTKFQGYDAFYNSLKWNLAQQSAKNLNGLEYDPDLINTRNGYYGAFSVATTDRDLLRLDVAQLSEIF